MSSPPSVNQGMSGLAGAVAPGEESASLSDREVSPIMRRGLAAFQRELPELLENHRGRWVAYHGDHRVALGSSKRQMYQLCLRQNLAPGEFLLRLVDPEIPEELDWNELGDY
jgi:hypothetical protein